MRSFRTVTLVYALALAAAGSAGASRTPVEPILPTGCASGPEGIFQVAVTASRQWGIVPFEIELGVTPVAGYDFSVEVAWDFDGDGLADTSGTVVRHTFTDPVDYPVSALVSTGTHGSFSLPITISGYAALMSVTFDDGQQSVYTVAFPILEARGLTATVYVVPTWMGYGWYLTWDNLHQLQDNGWDVGSHTLTHANLSQADSATLHFELSESRAQLQARGFEARHFSVPFGACTWAVVDAARLYYESCRGWPGLNPPPDEVDPYVLRWDVSARTKPLASYTAMIDSVALYGGWYILNNHLVYPDCSTISTCVADTTFAALLDYALEHRVKIVDIDEALAPRQQQALRPPRPAPPQAADPIDLTVEQPGGLGLPVTIGFTAPRGPAAEIGIYDVTGRRVRALAEVGAGRHTTTWDGRNDSGVAAAGGVYFCVLATADGRVATRKLAIVR